MSSSRFLDVFFGVFLGLWAFTLSALILAALVGVHWTVGFVK